MFFNPEVEYSAEERDKLLGTLRKEIKMAEHQLNRLTSSCRAIGAPDKGLKKTLDALREEHDLLRGKSK